MKKYLLIICFCLFFSSIYCEELAYSEDDYFNTLKNNRFVLDFSDKKGIDAVFEKDNINKYKIIFIGEVHGVAENYKLKFEFLKYFNTNFGFNYLLEEHPVSHNFYLNEYLKTGNEENLKIIFKPMYGTAFCTQEHYDFYKKLFQYNKKVSQDKQIKIISVDVEHQPIVGYSAMYSLLKNKKLSKEFLDFYNMLKKLVEKDTIEDSLYSLAKQCEEIVNKNTQQAKTVLGIDYDLFRLINTNILNREKLDATANQNFNIVRDKIMYSNFCTLDNSTDKRKYFGQLGNYHTWQLGAGGVEWFASQLNKTENCKNAILTFMIQYLQCEYANKNDNYKPYPCELHSIYLSNEYQKKLEEGMGNLFIYRLKSENSIFTKMNFSGQKAKGDEPVLSDLYQYVITVKASKSCKSINLN